MTVLILLCFLAVLSVCGVLPGVLLVPNHWKGHRISFMPVLGLCAGILATYGLASLGITGRTIAVVTLVIFVLAAILVITGKMFVPHLAGKRVTWDRIVIPPVDYGELKTVVPLLLSGVVALLLIGWPLFYQSYENFWGFANPDQPFYITIFKHLHTHSFGLPPDVTSGSDAGTSSGDSTYILGLSYFFSILTVISGVPIELLFGVACAGMLFLIPVSTSLLGELGFGLTRRASLTSGFLIAASALVAQTFYLESLGALTVVVLVPVGLTFAIEYTRNPSWRGALALALVIAGMYYCYYPGVGVMGLSVGAVLGLAVIRRTVSIRVGALPVGLTAGLLVLSFLPQAVSILGRLFTEAFSSRLAVSASSNEVILSFALVLTEEVVPFFWGFTHPGTSSQLSVGPFQIAFLSLFVFGCILFAALLLSAWRLSELKGDYRSVLAVLLGVMLIYFLGRNAYGVFRLIAWIQPLVIIGLTASCLGVARAMARRRVKVLAVLPLLLLVGHAGLNLAHTVQLGRIAIGANGSMQNLSSFNFSSFRGLTTMGPLPDRERLVIGLPDPVVQRWVMPFLPTVRAAFAPVIALNVEDSNSETAVSNFERASTFFRSGYLLHFDKSLPDIVPPSFEAPLWHNGAFALTPIAAYHNTLLLGAGWYRKEQYPDSPYAWQRSFRWLRKRAEAILLNPSPELQRLRLTLIAGYGDVSPKRHVLLWMNGQKLDEIEFTAYARVLSRPFVAAEPWTHLEIEVQETASLAPRPQGFWNLWVPRDPRRLNIAVAELALVPAERGDTDTNTTFDLTSQTAFTSTLFDGIYPDRWIGDQAMVELRVPPEAEAIEIAGSVPGVRTFRFPYRIRALMNGVSLGEKSLPGPGPFKLRFPLQDSSHADSTKKATIVVEPESTFVGAQVGVNEDQRTLSIRLDRIRVIDVPTTPVVERIRGRSSSGQ